LLHKKKLFFVGTGPGAIGLVTKRALSVLKKADLVIFGRFINPNILFYANSNAEFIDNISDEEILYKLANDSYKIAVWLTIGDPCFFSKHNRRIEQFSKLSNLDIEIVPGISSAIAVPEYSGILISKPDFTDTVTISVGRKVVSGKTACPKKSDSPTALFFLALDVLKELTQKLLRAGWLPDEPVAIIENGTTENRTIAGKLAEIADLAKQNGVSEPALFVCGKESDRKNRFDWFEKKPLFSKRIVVTRPMPNGLDTIDILEELGADVIYLPVVKLTRLSFDVDPSGYDLIIFTSAKSVSYFFEHVKPDSCNGLIASVGQKTADALAKYHIKADIVPDEFSSKALTEKLIATGVKGKTILIPGSEMMNPEMSLRLKESGADVRLLYLYKPEKNRIKWENLIRKKIDRWKNIDYLMLTSGFTAKMAAEFFDGHLLIKKSLKTVAISKNVGRIAENLGFKNIIVSKEATEESMIKKILDEGDEFED